eukprot:Seg1784.4 transcript_id=Seg1784.4/GoldUCD/mRNA.D3Y31 product="Protein JTB" protein_id=Seg1784.4/GoldUCD/D3Y31
MARITGKGMHLDPLNLATIVIGLVQITDLAFGHVIKTSPSKPMTGIPKEEKQNVDPQLCWKSETFITQSECAPCSSSDKLQLPICKETGNKQLIQCEKTKTKTYISCPFATSFEKKRFWTFEAISLAGAVISNVVVWWRRRTLNYVHYQRVKRQMSGAV